MKPEPDRSPELDNAATRRATDTLARILGCAILTGQEREPGAVPDQFTERPTPMSLFARPDSFADRAPAPQVLTHNQKFDARRREIADEMRERLHRARPPQGRLTVLDLRADDCRFAVSGTPFLFCGAPVIAGRSWCQTHALRVFRPVT